MQGKSGKQGDEDIAKQLHEVFALLVKKAQAQ
jgi:hypothetical protein